MKRVRDAAVVDDAGRVNTEMSVRATREAADEAERAAALEEARRMSNEELFSIIEGVKRDGWAPVTQKDQMNLVTRDLN